MKGMERMRKIVLALAAFICLSLPVAVNAKGWEPIKQEKATGHHVISDSELEIKTGGGIIFVNTTKSINIKIFTILGSRIADDTLQAGSYQFAVPTHGVYIIKAGDLTCKVAV